MSTNEPSSINRWLANIPISHLGRLFLVAGLLFWIGGAYTSYSGWVHDQRLEQDGRIADGTVLEKSFRTTTERRPGQRSHVGGSIETSYRVAFRFSTLGETISDTVEVDKEVYDRLQVQGPIRVTYLPDDPTIHRVEGQDTEFQLWKLLLWLAGGALFMYVGRLLLAGKLELGSESHSDD